YHQLGMVAQARGDYDAALEQYRKSLEISEQLGDRAGMATSYHQIGVLAHPRGSHDAAINHYRKSLEISEQLGDRAGMATSISQIGVLWVQWGSPEEAITFNLRALSLRLAMRSLDAGIDLHWLRRQRELLGEERFNALVREYL